MAKATRKIDRDHLGGLQAAGHRRLRGPGETRVLRAVEELRRDLRQTTDGERAVRAAVRHAATLFEAEDHCFAVITPGVDEADLVAFSGVAERWDPRLLAAFARGEKPTIPDRVAMARIRRRERPWGVIALRWDRGHIDWDVRRALTRFTRAINEILAEIDRDRIADVRARIDRKVMEQLRSRDLFYQILDGLRSLTRYDHSATLLIGERDEAAMEIVAQKLAWRRGKSSRIGDHIQLGADEFTEMLEHGVAGFSREGGGFRSWSGSAVDPWLAEFASERCSRSDREPPVGELLVGPLATRDGLRAILAIGAVHPGTLGPHEAALVSSFLPQVSVALMNSRRAEALEARMLETERKHAMADLARGVAHDVNNALGAVVPLLQQLRTEVDAGRVDPETLGQDLAQIDRSVRVCRDIFGGMLRFARTAVRPVGSGCVRSAVDMCLAILGDNLQRHRVTVEADVPEQLPRVALNQAELEQLVLNLVTNARDAIGADGRLTITARHDDDGVELTVEDDGCGIAAADLPRVQDPFYTTKATGNGLGLSICRSIVWRSHGEIEITSRAGQGTHVRLRLPVAAEPDTDTDPETTTETETGARE